MIAFLSFLARRGGKNRACLEGSYSGPKDNVEVTLWFRMSQCIEAFWRQHQGRGSRQVGKHNQREAT